MKIDSKKGIQNQSTFLMTTPSTSTNSIIRVTLNTEFDTMCLYPPNAQIANSEVLKFGVSR